MKISLSPQRRDDTLTVEKNGDRLRINGELLNFNPVPEGATIKASDIPCEWICGDVSRIDGELHLCLLLPISAEPAEYVAFPQPLDNPPDGVLDLPFSPYSETSEEIVEGGRNITTTRYEWRAEPVVAVEFIPNPPPAPPDWPLTETQEHNANESRKMLEAMLNVVT
ncbi:hypothetical protein JZX86_06015 [Agrobacterium rosae]|uniref:hypothetical protein n=1 Tax=Agrobacterium rosae TaxID=1972867 RepID=UPI0019D3F6D7|nr:hypothetical protein [Agrobacterium rosae]MBN7804920.1 hypothetical protein [Agrobacterium rosae]